MCLKEFPEGTNKLSVTLNKVLISVSDYIKDKIFPKLPPLTIINIVSVE